MAAKIMKQKTGLFWISLFLLAIITSLFLIIIRALDMVYPLIFYLLMVGILILYSYVEFRLVRKEKWDKSIGKVVLFGLLSTILISIFYAILFFIFLDIFGIYMGDMAGVTILIVPIVAAIMMIITVVFALILKAIMRK